MRASSTAPRDVRRRPRATLALRGLVLGLALALLPSCNGAGGSWDGVTVSLSLDPEPPRVGTTRVELSLVDSDGAALSGAELDLEGNMSHAGMVPSFAELSESAERPGTYVGDLEFTMGGDWFLLLEATLADGRVVERTLDVPGVRSR